MKENDSAFVRFLKAKLLRGKKDYHLGRKLSEKTDLFERP